MDAMNPTDQTVPSPAITPATRAGAWLWVACLQFFVAEQVARRGWTLPYSFARNYISDLGATSCGPHVCSPWHALMNASFGLQGLLIAGGALLLWRHGRALGHAGLAALVACGLGLLAVAIEPENAVVWVHAAGAAVHFLCGGLGMLLVGWRMRVKAARSAAGWLSMAAGLIVIAATVLLGQKGPASLSLLSTLGVGAVERVAAYGIVLWLVWMGGSLLMTSRLITSRTSGSSAGASAAIR